MEGSAALVKTPDGEYGGLKMVVSAAEGLRRWQELQAFVKEVMIGPVYHPDGTVKVHGVDFDVIPGTEKPTLLQPGAQKLCELYGLAAEFIFEEKAEDWDRPFFYYRVRTVLTDRRNASFVGMGIGSCNSREKKYAGRWVPLDKVPNWLKPADLKKREGIEWLWQSKLRERGITITDDMQTQKRQGGNGEYTVWGVRSVMHFVPNEEIPDLVNTFQKMACKRSHVHAVLQVTRSAGIFAQDVDELPPEAFGYVEQRRTWEGEPVDADFTEQPAAGAARPDLQAQREKLGVQAEKLRGGGTRSPAKAASTASTSGPNAPGAPAAPTTPDPAADAAKVAAFQAAIEGAADKTAFNAEWVKFKADPDYERLKSQLADLYKSKVAQFTPPPRDPKIDLWLGNISRAGGDEDRATWDALNDAYEGQVPQELIAAFEARWPSQGGGAST